MFGRLIWGIAKRVLIINVPLAVIAVVSFVYSFAVSGFWQVVLIVLSLLCGAGTVLLFRDLMGGASEDWVRWKNAVHQGEEEARQRLRQGGPFGQMLAGDTTPEEFLSSFETGAKKTPP